MTSPDRVPAEREQAPKLAGEGIWVDQSTRMQGDVFTCRDCGTGWPTAALGPPFAQDRCREVGCGGELAAAEQAPTPQGSDNELRAALTEALHGVHLIALREGLSCNALAVERVLPVVAAALASSEAEVRRKVAREVADVLVDTETIMRFLDSYGLSASAGPASVIAAVEAALRHGAEDSSVLRAITEEEKP